MRRRFRSFQLIGADCEYECVVLFYFGIVVCQLDELSAAERSPECAIEDECDVAMPSICAQGIFIAARARQREVRRKIAHIRSDG